MHKVIRSLFVAGALASSALFATVSPSSAEDAGSLFSRVQQSGAETSYARGNGMRGGGFRGGIGHRGVGRGGFAGRRSFGRGGLAGRGYRNRGFAARGYYGRQGYGYGYRRRGIGAGAVLGGLAAGAIVGGALAAQATHAPGRNDAYCAQRFRSYDPASGTYLGNDGQRHACP